MESTDLKSKSIEFIPMNASPLSIVTVVRNNLPLLLKTIDSLNFQNEKSFEYIIIDGASSDATREFVLEKPKPSSIVVSEPDEGIYNAMNKAPVLCSGEYIQYLNAGDTLYDADTLRNILPYLDGCADIILFNYRIDGKHHRPDLSLRYLLGNSPCHQAIFYRRKFLLQHPFETKLKYCADFHHLLNALTNQAIHIADPIVIEYDTTGVSSAPQARRRIRLERAWSAWNSNLTRAWRIAIAGYNLIRLIH